MLPAKFKLPPTYVDTAQMLFVGHVAYDALPETFTASPTLGHHVLPEASFSLRNARLTAMQRFDAQPERQVQTVMPRPATIALYTHAQTGRFFYKCAFEPFSVYTFFKQASNDRITLKIEQRVNIWFTANGHLAYVERLSPLGAPRLSPPPPPPAVREATGFLVLQPRYGTKRPTSPRSTNWPSARMTAAV